jgi:hypothetical protein
VPAPRGAEELAVADIDEGNAALDAEWLDGVEEEVVCLGYAAKTRPPPVRFS